MADIIIKQLKGATFIAKGASNHWVAMDGTDKVGGFDAAARPLEMVLFGLGGCTAVDVKTILEKMKLNIENIEIEIDSERADEHPKVFTKIKMVYHFYGKNLALKKLEKAVNLSKETYCSVTAMLKHSAEFEVSIENHNTAE
jgi:putative redox protein